MREEDYDGIERNACPSVGACGGMYTANTMSSSFEALGMSLLGTLADGLARRARRPTPPPQSARVLVEAIKNDLKPRDIITRKSIENAIALVMATGGSTNAVLHYLAIASAAEVAVDDRRLRAHPRKRVPVLCDLKPSGRFVAVDLHRAGGVPQVLKMLLDARPPARRLHDDHRPHDRARSSRCAGRAARRPGRDPAVVEPDVRAGPSRDPARQPRD